MALMPHVLADRQERSKNVDTHKSLRIHEMPKVELCLVPSTAAPTGVGVPGVPPLARRALSYVGARR